jgi:hypothetical protein
MIIFLALDDCSLSIVIIVFKQSIRVLLSDVADLEFSSFLRFLVEKSSSQGSRKSVNQPDRLIISRPRMCLVSRSSGSHLIGWIGRERA